MLTSCSLPLSFSMIYDLEWRWSWPVQTFYWMCWDPQRQLHKQTTQNNTNSYQFWWFGYMVRNNKLHCYLYYSIWDEIRITWHLDFQGSGLIHNFLLKVFMVEIGRFGSATLQLIKLKYIFMLYFDFLDWLIDCTCPFV